MRDQKGERGKLSTFERAGRKNRKRGRFSGRKQGKNYREEKLRRLRLGLEKGEY